MARPSMKRPPPTPPPPPPGGKHSYSEFERMWPNLLAFLMDETYEDGSRRTTGTLLFFFQDGQFKACLNDRDCARAAFLTAPGVHEACDALEEGLANESLDWRAKRSP